MRLPPEKIEEVRNSIDIVDLIGMYVQIKKKGKNYVGLCPFHNEKTPSFTVSSEKQMYYCFGCNAGGNSISFVMEFDKLSFIEAVKLLAKRAGITLPSYTPKYDAIAEEQEQLYLACKEASTFFQNNLVKTNEGKFALNYLYKRGLSDESIRTFGLGYSLNSWDSFIKFSEKEKISPYILEKAGLVRKREDGSYYDYFRGRVMFPIFSSTGKIIGFGARKIYEDDKLGKYINSPETLIYNKSRILYGISHAKEAIREKDSVILVEGYIDLIRVFQEGIKNIVATSGTALSVEQIQLISRYTKNIIIVYDADSAGSKATLRGVDLILENDLDVKVSTLPQGEDPDSFIGKYGKEKFWVMIKNSVSFVDFIAKALEQEIDLRTPEGQTKAVRVIIQTIAKIKDEIKKNLYIQSVAEKYGISRSLLQKELEKYIQIKQKQTDYQEIEEKDVTTLSKKEVANNVLAVADNIPKAEKDIILAMLEGGRLVAEFVFSYLLPDKFLHPYTRLIAQQIHALYTSGVELNAAMLIDSLAESSEIGKEEIAVINKFITKLVFDQYELSKRWAEEGVVIVKGDALKLARDALRAIFLQSVQKRMEENLLLMQNAKKRGEDLSYYLNIQNQLIEEKKIVLSGKIFQYNQSD